MQAETPTPKPDFIESARKGKFNLRHTRELAEEERSPIFSLIVR